MTTLALPSNYNDIQAAIQSSSNNCGGVNYNPAFQDVKKKPESFRNFGDGPRQEYVQNFYKKMNSSQSYEFVEKQRAKYLNLNHAEMTVWEVIEWLDTLVDESDPDTDLPNSFHDFQTAERIRQDHPDKEWYQLVGLLHDLGKILAKFGEEQFSVVGDTFPVGCKFSDSIVFSEYLKENPDYSHPIYSTENGIYEAGCGLDKLTMCFGHDEYMYHVLQGNNCKIPEEGLYMIRYHSFYPWHRCNAYSHFETEKDREMKKWVLDFNKYDLYSKSDTVPDVKTLKPYYQKLVEKYCPGKLKW
jgi:inositol oxygenase